jgi:hypothetical protein
LHDLQKSTLIDDFGSFDMQTRYSNRARQVGPVGDMKSGGIGRLVA